MRTPICASDFDPRPAHPTCGTWNPQWGGAPLFPQIGICERMFVDDVMSAPGTAAELAAARVPEAAQGHVLHADLDSFFAAVEQRDDPSLRGRPVLVGGGVVLAASYEARRFGVHSAMGGAEARRLCPGAVFVRPRMEAYAEASRAVFAVFEDTTPLVEALSIDEAFLEVGGLRRLAGTPTEIAVRLRRTVRERVGLPITVGVARTKFLAKVASRVAKP